MRPPTRTSDRLLVATGVLVTGATLGALVGGSSARARGAVGGAVLAGFGGALVGHFQGPTWRPFGDTLSLEILGLFTALTVVTLVRDTHGAIPPKGQLPTKASVVTPADSGKNFVLGVGDLLDFQLPPAGQGHYWLVADYDKSNLFEQQSSKQTAQMDETVLVARNKGTTRMSAWLMNFDGTQAGQNMQVSVTVV